MSFFKHIPHEGIALFSALMASSLCVACSGSASRQPSESLSAGAKCGERGHTTGTDETLLMTWAEAHPGELSTLGFDSPADFDNFARVTHDALHIPFRIQLGWEVEGISPNVHTYYHVPEGIIGIPSKEGSTFHHKSPAAPAYWNDTLELDAKGVWEVKNGLYSETISEYFAQIDDVVNKIEPVTFHGHVSFVVSYDDLGGAFGEQLARFLVHINQYATLKLYRANHKEKLYRIWIRNNRFGNPTGTFDQWKNTIALPLEYDTSLMAMTVALRYWNRDYSQSLYAQPDNKGLIRIGIEPRSPRSADELKMLVLQVVKFLLAPNAPIRFGAAAPAYSLNAVQAFTLNDQLRPWHNLTPDTRFYINALADFVAQHTAPEPDGSGLSMRDEYLRRWAIPLIAWENPFSFSSEQMARAAMLRNQFANNVETWAAMKMNKAITIDDYNELADMIHTWALQYPIEGF